ncbi:PEGA domain-containing protein [Candidatus Woesebacteria bacterium]|nr:PEGA domain-containing protein [Candidatus Woesebacteria bacterium]
MFLQVNKRVLYTFISILVIVTGTVVAIQYATGSYRLTNAGIVKGTGLLAANSFPTGAEVLINDKLVTATDDTLYLEPGDYDVEIKKDGYIPWKKSLTIEESLVTQTNATLFPVAPNLNRLTYTGVTNLSPSPDGQKLLYYTASQSAARKNGLYIMDLSTAVLPINLERTPRQIAEDVPAYDLKKAQFIWSPDSTEVLIITPQKKMLVPVSQTSDLRTLTDVSFQEKQILSEWEFEMYTKERQYLSEFPPAIITVATQSAKNVYLSPDKKRLLYTATAVAEIPDNLVPALPARNHQPEDRILQPGSIYIYDREEDKNFKIASEPQGTTASKKSLLATDLFTTSARSLTSSPSAFTSLQGDSNDVTVRHFAQYYSSLYSETMQWYPDSRHLFFIQDNAVMVVEYDGTNLVTLYSGPFEKNFLYPWPDGSRILILTSFSPDAPANLYAIELK